MSYIRDVLEVGKTFVFDGWYFVVVKVRDEFSFDVLCLTDFGWRHKAGEVTEVRRNSAVGQGALEVK